MLEFAQRYLSRWQAAAATDARRVQSPPAAAPTAHIQQGPSAAAEAPPLATAVAAVAEEGQTGDVSARLEALLAQLEPAHAAELRVLLRLQQPAEDFHRRDDEVDEELSRSHAALMRQQGLISSGPMAFGAVFDALQVAAQKSVGERLDLETKHIRLAVVVMLLALATILPLALLGASLFRAGVRHGRSAAAKLEHCIVPG